MHKIILLLAICLTPSLPAEIIYSHPFNGKGDPCEYLQMDAKKTDDEKIRDAAPGLEERLNKHVLGQEYATKVTADAIVRFAAGVNDPNSPVATFLYCGPSGVGKTELAKKLCDELYGDPTRFVRINMSEFTEAHTISRLIGAPPGYVGYEEGGQLSKPLLQNAYSVVLLDECEKAHPQILKLFLHIFDEGVFASAAGKKVDCRKCVFIMTSNLAATEIATMFDSGYAPEDILDSLQPYFMQVLSPELYNRLEVIVFSPLTYELRELLVVKLLGELKKKIYQRKQIDVFFDNTLVAYLADCIMDPTLGARPLKRKIDKELGTIIGKAILKGNVPKGSKIKCYYIDGNITVDRI